MPAGIPGLAPLECHRGGQCVEKASYAALGTQWRLRRYWSLMYNLLPHLFRQSARGILHVLHGMYPFFIVWIALKTGILSSLYRHIGNFSDIFNAQHAHASNLLQSVPNIIHTEKRIDFMSNMKKCTVN
jgi:hypothetical protein